MKKYLYASLVCLLLLVSQAGNLISQQPSAPRQTAPRFTKPLSASDSATIRAELQTLLPKAHFNQSQKRPASSGSGTRSISTALEQAIGMGLQLYYDSYDGGYNRVGFISPERIYQLSWDAYVNGGSSIMLPSNFPCSPGAWFKACSSSSYFGPYYFPSVSSWLNWTAFCATSPLSISVLEISPYYQYPSPDRNAVFYIFYISDGSWTEYMAIKIYAA
jgi:hypothetical protein